MAIPEPLEVVETTHTMQSGAPSGPNSHASRRDPIDLSTNQKMLLKCKDTLKKYGTFIGPGLLVSVAYMDPGNYATGITAGASNKYSLLFFVFLSNIIAIFLQSLCIKLGSVTGYDLARCCREHLPRWLNLTVWVLAECAIIATDIAEVIGSAIALNILLKVPLPAGVVITIVDVLFVLMAYKNDTASTKFVRYFEFAVAAMVMTVVVCFAVELSQILANAREVFRGFVPSAEMMDGNGLTIATSIIGSTVMIHSLFLGSGLVQPRLREYDVVNGLVKLEDVHNDGSSIEEYKTEKEIQRIHDDKEAAYFYNEYKPSLQAIRYSLKYSIVELVITLFTVALFVNAAILIVAGSTLHGTPEAIDADLYTIYHLLSRNLAPAVGTIFMVALLFSGQSAGIVCTIAGQMVSEGHINWTVKPWLRRLITRSISIVPCLIVSVCIGRNGLNIALNISQVIISILLPPLTTPLIYFTCKKSIMRVEIPAEEVAANSALEVNDLASDDETTTKKYKYMANNWVTTVFVVAIWLFISVLNVYAIYQMAKDGVN
ncbi:transporter protein SMF1/ESP1 [Suhomyces tanzawaensis NRRL Y-17324]|uniref:Transporter protein SMF1/ESP1 n=1 Tax=Suhomyces tanzawaensis NRRL Y-17324 TaxID=984487 RepID=A0A1E4SKZ6_9ASCO|nr:transporter protein SMF1/ESP1 [Suhomyces tanzawaensis NRRL Y-17324]ODV80173.1 transporter protein SMF1/ESP1 [Suhomyces tanzawaensis NRRL Y-17324]